MTYGLAGAVIAAGHAALTLRSLRAREAERGRLRELARSAGVRIREHLAPEDLISEAQAVIENELGADAAHLHVLDEDGRFGLPAGHGHHRSLPDGFTRSMPPAVIAVMRDLYRRGASLAIEESGTAGGQHLPPEALAWIRDAGIASQLLTPFGDGPDMLGVIAAPRLRPGHPWTQPEIEAVESIAADIGRGLRQARLYEAEKHLVAELRSVDAMKTDFYATVAHELRSPLTSIAGCVEMLADGDGRPADGTQRQKLEMIERAVGRLRDLVENLLTLVTMESGSTHLVKRAVNLADVIARAAEVILPAAADARVTLTTECPPAGLIVEGDPDHLDRALVNLMSNAVKYTPEGGNVWVTGKAAAGWAVVTVRDTGIGIPEADREHLFERFFRASNAVGQGIPGTGLGLAIVRALIGFLGGRVSLDSREGEGTTVTVRLPLERDRPSASAK